MEKEILEKFEKEFEEFKKEYMGENKERFKEGKANIVKKSKEVLEEAEELQLVITEKSLLANGTAAALLAGVCTLIEKMNREGLPKDVIMSAMDSATNGKSDKEQLQELFEELIDRL